MDAVAARRPAGLPVPAGPAGRPACGPCPARRADLLPARSGVATPRWPAFGSPLVGFAPRRPALASPRAALAELASAASARRVRSRAPRAGASDSPRPSPFEGGSLASEAADGGEVAALTAEAADRALDDVRPYLVADGGEISVVGVEGGVVSVRFRGACSTCESSSATLRLGVEKTLRAAFGDSLIGVVDVGPEPDAVDVGLADVDACLDSIRGALRAMGATVETVGFRDGVCTLWYEGPPALARGVRDAVLERFRERVTAVRVVDPSTSEVLLDA